MFSYWKLSQVFSGRRQSRNKSFTYDMWLNNAYLSSGTSKHLYSISHQFPFSKSLINTLFYMHINKALLVKKFLLGFSSVAQSCPTLCDPMNRSTPGFPVHHQLPEFTQTHIHWVRDAIQPSHPLPFPSPPAPNPSQHQSVFQWVNSSHEVAKVLEFQLQHQSFQRTPRTDLL